MVRYGKEWYFWSQFHHFENSNLKLSIVSDIENKFMDTKGEREMEEKVRMGDYHIHTTISKIDNQKDLL